MSTKVVKLNKAELRTLKFASPSERASIQAQLLAEKQAVSDKRFAAYQEVKAKRAARMAQPMEFALTELGFVVIKNTGTRRDAILSHERAVTLVKNIQELSTLLESAPIVDKE